VELFETIQPNCSATFYIVRRLQAYDSFLIGGTPKKIAAQESSQVHENVWPIDPNREDGDFRMLWGICFTGSGIECPGMPRADHRLTLQPTAT
jgi:hypothetical protein